MFYEQKIRQERWVFDKQEIRPEEKQKGFGPTGNLIGEKKWGQN